MNPEPRQVRAISSSCIEIIPKCDRDDNSSRSDSIESKPTVIYVDPKIIKKFIEKSMKLSDPNLVDANARGIRPNRFTKTYVNSSSIDTVDFKTCSKDLVMAGCTMAIIRLVTECVQDDKKRDEKLNKILVSRLMSKLLGSDDNNDTGTTINSIE